MFMLDDVAVVALVVAVVEPEGAAATAAVDVEAAEPEAP